MTAFRFWRLLAGLGMAFAVLGPVHAQAVEPPLASQQQDYVLGPGDVIEVSVLGRSDFTTHSRIGAEGDVQLPFLGKVTAANLTPSQLSDEVGRQLEAGGLFTKPIVKVDIVSYASRYVIVLGAVTAPGLVSIDRPYRVSEILAKVGGLKETAADYVTLRPAGGPERRLSVEGLATGGLADDPYVAPGEKIYSPPASLFYVSGEVKTPGAFPLVSGMTVGMAIARGGGLSDFGNEHGVRITRRGTQLKSVGLTTPIEPGDVIVVGERLF